MVRKKEVEKARDALTKLRRSRHVDPELETIQLEISKTSKSGSSFSIADLFRRSELRWPLITGLVIQVAQQLCGVNAVNFIF